MQYLKYILWLAGAFFLVVGAGAINGNINVAPIVFGILLIIAGSFIKIKDLIVDFTSSKAQDDLLKLKSLYDQGILTKEEYEKKAEKLKERI